MTRWKTEDVVKLLTLRNVTIAVDGPGGDVDTQTLRLKVRGSTSTLYVSGFVTQGVISTPDDCDVEMVELSDGEDSRGGLNSTNEKFGNMYVKVRKLLTDAGFVVTPCMKDYF